MRLSRTALALVVALFSLVTAASASAQVTLGELPSGVPTAACSSGPYEDIPGGLGEAAYRVPVDGVITSWSTSAAEGSGQEMTFKVYRPLGGGRYMIVGHDGPRTLIPSIVDTFATSIPVKAGDLIGNNDANADDAHNACQFATGTPGDLNVYPPEGDYADGETVEEEGAEVGYKVNVRATLLPAPTIASLGTTSGPTTGGTAVAISGANFAEVKGVAFGSAAASFTVGSESSITATAPAGAAGEATVSVTTAAGTATAPQKFLYVAPPIAPAPVCKVPNLKGKKLKAAKKKIKAADCKLGKVTKKKGVTNKTGKVVKQGPKAGVKKAAGTKVTVKLG